MKQLDDSIEKLIIAFKYQDKALASRCNTMIESIYDSKILPAMDKAIVKTIPNEIPIQFDSLEIDLGTINEKELPAELAKRIEAALKDTLHKTLNNKQYEFRTNNTSSSQNPHEYLIGALELYLIKGYLPSWISGEISIWNMTSILFDESQNDLIQMIMRNKGNESLIKRLKLSLEPKRFDNLISKIAVTDYQSNNKSLVKKNVIMTNNQNAEIRIYNSGLIILWPFLTRFFEQLSLVKNGEFVNGDSRYRAVFLLQYLTYNRIDFPEYELVMNKLIVGLPLESLLSTIAEITKDEKDLSVSLLNGVIANWDKVKSSSIEAIQETFLQREGILKIKKESVALVIEKKGVDVLLNSLSWNISLIKLPWMQKPIHIEWV